MNLDIKVYVTSDIRHSPYLYSGLEILKSAINAYDKIKSEDEQNIKPMYRQKEWQRNKRREEECSFYYLSISLLVIWS